MLRIYTKLPLYLSVILSLFLHVEAKAEPWSQNSCKSRCTNDTCQKNFDMKKLCQIKCSPAYLPEACGGTHQGATSTEILNGEEEDNNDYQAVPPPPPITRYYESAMDESHTLMTEEIPQRAQALEGNILREALIPEIPDMMSDRDVVMEEDTPILTLHGIFKVLKKMGKINSNFDLNKIPNEIVPLGYQTEVKENVEEDGGEIHEEVIASFSRGYTGTFSSQIFLVTISDNLLPNPGAARKFVVKGVAWIGGTPPDKITSRKEPTPIKELQNTARVQQIIVPKLQKNNVFFLPNLYTSEDIGYYFDEKGNKNYIAVLETAPGETLSGLTDSFLNSINSGNTDPSLSENWNEAMAQVGMALGKLHWLMASPEVQENFRKDFNLTEFKTVVHGDFHFNNIFYDETRPYNKVSFIDVSSMADSIYNPISVLDDLYAFYNYTKYFHHYLNNLDGNGIKLINEGFKSFAYGYALAVAPDKRAELEAIIYNQFKLWTYLVQSHYASFMDTYQAWMSEHVPSAVDDGNFFADPRNMMVEKMRKENTVMIPSILHNMLQDPINE